MHRNYFALYHAAQELHEVIAGGYLFEIHSQDRNELTLSFVTPDGRHLQLIVTVRAQEFSISTREGLNRKRRNAASIMDQAYELQVTSVSMAPRDREILIALERNHLIVVRFFSADTNVLLVHEGLVVDAFKDKRELEGTPYDAGSSAEPVFRSLELLAGDKTHFMALLAASDTRVPLDRRLASILPGFDRALARKLIMRVESEPSPDGIFSSLTGLLYELASPSPNVVEAAGNAPEFSILEPPEGSDATRFDDVLEALGHYTRKMHRFLHLHAGAVDLRKDLLQRISRTERELAELETADPLEASGRFETFGHLLTGAIGKTETISGKVTVQNIFEPGTPDVTIPVKPDRNMQQNAAWYFSRASRSREKVQATDARRSLLVARLGSLRLKLDGLDVAQSGEELRKLIGKGKHPKEKTTVRGRKKQDRPARFRTVPLTSEITLYVGKDATNNELLTFGHARPDDIWLHARGASGSHCVLKGAGMDQMSEIRRAAEIAAWYSAARNSGLVPVIYALKKYVRKAKGATGSVIVEREKVLMVSPRKE
jgi:predicted ribosome quality control (RQC) complex YloA/Tae2 family protein